MNIINALNNIKKFVAFNFPVPLNHYVNKVTRNQFKVKEQLNNLMTDETFFGSILIGRNNKTMQYNIGYLSQTDCHFITDDTLYLTGSIQKFFTGIRMAQLEEQQLLHRKHPIKKYFPAINSEHVILEDLLLHRSGMKAYHPDSANSYDECIRYILKDTFDADKVGEYAYNDGNYVLLSKVIEIVTGQSYKQNILTNIVKPLKMFQTYFYDDVKGLVARPMAQVKDTLCPYYEEPLVQYFGAGNMYMSLHDVYILVNAFLNDALMDPATKASLIRPSDRYKQDYRYGFGVKQGYFRIRGVLNGIEVIAWFNKEQTVIVATNLLNSKDGKKCERLAAQIFEKEINTERQHEANL